MSIVKRKAGSDDIVKSVLEFDAVPTEGSHNLVESGSVAQAIGNLGQPLQWKGPATVSELNTGITGIQPGWTYTLTDSGMLTDGSIVVDAGDEVAWTEDGEWFQVGPSLVELKADVVQAKSDIADIQDVVPEEASDSNKLVTKDELDNVQESIQSGFTPKGEISVSDLNDLTTQSNGDQYILTDSGTITDGSVTVEAGDSVAWNSTDSVWYKVNQYALSKYGTDEIKNLPTTITAFRTGDVIPVDGPGGTANMSKDDLLKEAAQNSLAGNVAPEFDPTRTSAKPYKAFSDLVVYAGKTWIFRNDHYGPWDAADVIQFNLSSQWLNRLMANVAVYNWGSPATIPNGSLVRYNGLVYLALEELHYADGFDYDKVIEFSAEKLINLLHSNQPFDSIVPRFPASYNKYLDSAGVEQPLSSGLTAIWVVTDYVPLKAGKLYKYRYAGSMGAGRYAAFYDSSKNFVKSFTIAANSSGLINAPADGFVRFSLIVDKNTLVRNLSVVELPIDEEIGMSEAFRYNPNYKLVERTQGYYIDSSGNEVASSTGSSYWNITDYIPVSAGETIYYYNLNITGTAPYSAFYDANKDFVSSFKQGQGGFLSVKIPNGVSFVRFSFLQFTADSQFKFGVFGDSVKLNRKLIDSMSGEIYSPLVWSDDYLCINGDSIEAPSSGRWPTLLMDNIPWGNKTDIAVGGTRMAGEINSDERVARIPLAATIVVTGGGTNDWAQNIPIGSLATIDDPTTFYGAVYLYVQKVKARVPDAVVVFVSNPFGCCPDRFSSSHDDTLGIWNNNDNTIFDYAKAMKDVANFDSCYYIPVYEECGINSENFEDYLLHEYNSGAQVWVYLHPNDAGAARIERVIENHLKKIAELN